MRRLRIGEKEIGEGRPCFIVAELSCNHQGNPALAAEMIDAAAACGADAVKLQRRNIDLILTQEALGTPYTNERSFGETYGAHRRALELPDKAWPALKAQATEKGLLFFATPYDLDSLDFLMRLEVPAIKIASADVTNPPLLKAAAKRGYPILLSTGMCSEEELNAAVRLIWHHTQDLVILHCVSAYPADNKDLNLRYMLTLKKRFGTIVGYSGHEHGIAPSLAAVTLGASVIERHFTLDRTARGPDHAASLEAEGLRRLVRDIRNIEAALKEQPKKILASEVQVRARLAKSLVAARSIDTGEVIERSMLAIKGPGTGISPLVIDTILGKHAAQKIPADSLLRLEWLR